MHENLPHDDLKKMFLHFLELRWLYFPRLLSIIFEGIESVSSLCYVAYQRCGVILHDNLTTAE